MATLRTILIASLFVSTQAFSILDSYHKLFDFPNITDEKVHQIKGIKLDKKEGITWFKCKDICQRISSCNGAIFSEIKMTPCEEPSDSCTYYRTKLNGDCYILGVGDTIIDFIPELKDQHFFMNYSSACRPKSESPPDEPEGAPRKPDTYEFDAVERDGTECFTFRYKCLLGHSLKGEAVRTCCNDGSDSGINFECKQDENFGTK